MRTYEQMYEAAIAQRQAMINEGRDPKDGLFDCTKEEHLVILDKPPFARYELSAELVRRGIPIRSPKIPAPKSRPQPLTHGNGYAFGTRMRERAYIAEGEE